MANTSSARKMVRKIARRTERNKDQRSRMRTAIRRVEEAVAEGDVEQARNAFRSAESLIARAGRKGLLHARTAARKTSSLARRIASISS